MALKSNSAVKNEKKPRRPGWENLKLAI